MHTVVSVLRPQFYTYVYAHKNNKPSIYTSSKIIHTCVLTKIQHLLCLTVSVIVKCISDSQVRMLINLLGCTYSCILVHLVNKYT